jgi:hypothetical protein
MPRPRTTDRSEGSESTVAWLDNAGIVPSIHHHSIHHHRVCDDGVLAP